MLMDLPKVCIILEVTAWKQKMMTNQRVIVGMVGITSQEKLMYIDKLILIPMNFTDTNIHGNQIVKIRIMKLANIGRNSRLEILTLRQYIREKVSFCGYHRWFSFSPTCYVSSCLSCS